MMNVKKTVWAKVFHILARHFFYGVTEEDFTDLRKISPSSYLAYATKGDEVYANDVFREELNRLRFKQERYLINKAEKEDDLLFGKAVLYTIDLIEKRFKKLALDAETMKREQADGMDVS